MADTPKHETPTPAGPASTPAAPKKKMDSGLKIALIIVGVLVGLGILATIAMTVFVGSIFNHAAKNVKVNGNGDGGTVTVKTNDGQTSATYGTGAKLQAGFPTDVPIYKPSTLVASSKTGDNSYSASAKTNDSVDKVTNYYRDQLASGGWTNVHESSYQDGNIMDYKKDNRTLVLSISNQKNETTEKTYITLTTSVSQ